MPRINPIRRLLLDLRVGLFLGVRQIYRTNTAMSVLIIGIMMLTFLNLVVVTGVLVGLPTGATIAYSEQYAGDILITTPEDKQYIEQSQSLIVAIKQIAEVDAVSPRYMTRARIESDYKTVRSSDEIGDQISTMVVGIHPSLDDVITGASYRLAEGEYLRPEDDDGILVSARIVEKYAVGVPGDSVLSSVDIGSKLRVTIGENAREFTVRGIIKGKAQPANQWVYVNGSRLREMLGRFDRNVQQIAVKLNAGADAEYVRAQIDGLSVSSGAVVETAEEAQGQFFEDIVSTFTILGNGIGSLGLAASGVTIFIVIFISAITRRRYIGILKGIGIGGFAIEFAYVVQALAYMVVGTTLGVLVTYGFLIPFIAEHPIDFPFSDGILIAPISWAVIRIIIIAITTVFAGYVPAKMIVRRNTLDAILGR